MNNRCVYRHNARSLSRDSNYLYVQSDLLGFRASRKRHDLCLGISDGTDQPHPHVSARLTWVHVRHGEEFCEKRVDIFTASKKSDWQTDTRGKVTRTAQRQHVSGAGNYSTCCSTLGPNGSFPLGGRCMYFECPRSARRTRYAASAKTWNVDSEWWIRHQSAADTTLYTPLIHKDEAAPPKLVPARKLSCNDFPEWRQCLFQFLQAPALITL